MPERLKPTLWNRMRQSVAVAWQRYFPAVALPQYKELSIDDPRLPFQILDAITDLVIVKRSDSRFFWGNKAFQKFYGMSNEQLQGLVDAPFVQPDLTQQYVRDDMQVLRTGETLFINEEPVIRYDGEVRWVSTVKIPLKLHGFDPLLIVVCRDITDQREANRIIAEQRTQIIASAKLSALGEMAAGIAHEINNPLAIIAGRATNLRTIIAREPQNVDLITKFAADIETTSQRIAKIVRGLRSFAREGDNDPFLPTPLQTIIDDTLAMCAGRFKNHGINLDIGRFPSGASIECRQVQISQVLLNLLANAFDAVEETTIKWVTITITPSNMGYMVAVTDSGQGIPELIRDRIFHPFFTTKPVGKGTGLGLSVTKGLVECHQGTISLDINCPNTRFLVWLPERQNHVK